MRHVVLLTCFLLIGCSESPTEPGAEHTFATERENGITWALQHGIVEFYGDSVRIDLPATARAGEAFTVALETTGRSCSQQGETRVDRKAGEATIAPLDWKMVESDDQIACISIPAIHEHTVELSFDTPGTATVHIRGVRTPDNHLVTRSFDIEIRP